MSIRPFRDINRRTTKVINVGKVKIGGNNPISVQSMTNTLTKNAKETLNQINKISEAGADIVRVSCPDEESTVALREITKEVRIPIIADIHFHYKRAIEAAKFGAACLRINPGNIGKEEKVKEVIGEDLNGFVLEDVAIDYLEQTDLKFLNVNDTNDAQGIEKIVHVSTSPSLSLSPFLFVFGSSHQLSIYI